VPTPPPAPAANTGGLTALSLAERLKAGTLTTGQAGKLARAGGIDVTEVARSLAILNEPTPPKPEEAHNPELALLNQYHPPAEKDSDYLIQLPHGMKITTPEDKQTEAQTRVWLRAMEFPVLEGNALGTAVLRVAHAWNERTRNMTDEQRAAYFTSYDEAQGELLSRVFRESSDTTWGKIAAMIEQADKTQPGLKDFIKNNLHLFSDAQVVALFAQQADRLHMRLGR